MPYPHDCDQWFANAKPKSKQKKRQKTPHKKAAGQDSRAKKRRLAAESEITSTLATTTELDSETLSEIAELVSVPAEETLLLSEIPAEETLLLTEIPAEENLSDAENAEIAELCRAPAE